MPTVAAASLLALTAIAAVVPGAQGPASRSTAAPTAATPFGTNDAAARRLTVDGTAIYYEVYGDGPPVLLLHGGLYGYIAEYAPYIVELAKRHTVIAVATRGHGRSEVGWAPYTHDLLAGDAVAVLRRETREAALVIGFSYGAQTAFRLAARHPAAVRKVVVIGAGFAPSPQAVEWARGLTADGFARDNAGFVAGRKAIMPRPEEWPRFFELLRASLLQTPDLTPAETAAIRCPVLIVGGDRDFYNPVSVFHRVHGRLAGSRLIILRDADHVQSLVRPDVLRNHVLPFLAE
jgi:pimeloyl-ACP methyl ester carboxylesterase